MTLAGRDALLPGVLEAEAARIDQLLTGAGELSPLLNVGSSTAEFRERDAPHIGALVFAGLRRRGVAVTHLDLKGGDGVDIVGDVLDSVLRGKLKRQGYRAILLSNVLEHVRDRAAVARACEEIVGSGGRILATVPQSYPYHADPLDTLYRPAPEALAALFAGSDPIVTETIVGPTYAETLRASGTSVMAAAFRTLQWLLLAPVRPRSTRSRLDRWRWYRRPYLVSLVLVEVR